MSQLRTCIGCGEKAPRAELLRLVADPAGVLVLDPEKSAPGRGAWAHPRVACLEQAQTMRAIGRAFRGKLRPPPVGSLLEGARQAGVVMKDE